MEAKTLKTVGILTRPDFDAGISFVRQVLTYLESQKNKVLLPSYLAERLERTDLAQPLNKLKADFVITLGGDGTLLFAARHLSPDIPILPVNLTSFGFLSECEIHEVEMLIDQVLAGKLFVQETPKLAVRFKKKRLPDAANEVSFFTVDQGRPVPTKIQINAGQQFNFQANGFIVATPMGSTGHTLSLGGPILDIRLHAFLLLAVAPLRQGFLPLIIPSSSEITVELGKASNLFIDGDQITEIPPTKPISINQSESTLRILRRPSRFYTRLQGKLLRC